MTEYAQSWAGPAKALTPAVLAEHHALCSLCKTYALGMDLRDFELVASAFAADAKVEGQNGLEPFRESMSATFAFASSFKSTQHLIGQQYVEVDRDDATVWSYGVAHHKVATGEDRDEIIAGVQYRDKCKRFEQGWLIVERVVHNLWVDIQPRASKM